jgi:L-ribulose-5-phosphate 3-epimerase
MRSIKPMEIGLVFWAEQNAETTLQQLEALDICSGQLGVPPELSCEVVLDNWANGLNQSNLSVSSAVCCYAGEDYSNLATTKVVSEFARALDIPALSCHIGFIPTHSGEALYTDLCDLTKLLCDYCANHGQNFVLETGQESAEVLLSFIHNVNRQNLKVNFDPANMIMYQSGDPLAALKILSPHVISVHCKDAHFPAAGATGLLGKECALGDGEVDFPAFLQDLKEIDYRGILSIEREEPNAEKRIADIKTGILRLKQWKSNFGL